MRYSVFLRTGFTIRSDMDEAGRFIEYDEAVVNWLNKLRSTHPRVGVNLGTAAAIVSFSEESVAVVFKRLFGRGISDANV